jgi:hypothetical protein
VFYQFWAIQNRLLDIVVTVACIAALAGATVIVQIIRRRK